MARPLDEIDHKILRILQERGRISNIELSREIELSPAPTLERVRKISFTARAAAEESQIYK